MMQNLVVWAPFLGVVGLMFAAALFLYVKKQPVGTPTMEELAEHIHTGSLVFLSREYKILSVVMLIVFLLLGWKITWATAVAFLFGALCSMVAGSVGVRSATRANLRTSVAAKEEGQRKALLIAFSGGAVSGICLASLGVFGIGFVYLLYADSRAAAMSGFALGASALALFIRLGGGVFTKSTDVGADLVVKVEKEIPENDLRSPAVIADLVGDNIGGILGMGTDVFESYVGAAIATMALGATMSGMKWMAFPILVMMGGLVASTVGVLSMHYLKNIGPQTAFRYSAFIGAAIMLFFSVVLSSGLGLPIGIFWAVFVGCLAGIVIGLLSGYYTSSTPILKIVDACKNGPATNVIAGMATGMESVALPVVMICMAIFLAYYNGVSHGAGLYCIGVSAVGLLATTGVMMSVDAYGPIAENAGGIAEMSQLGTETQKITSRLDAIGNTSVAMGKGFAIGASALTALALVAAYCQTINALRAKAGIELIQLSLMDAKVLIGLFIGGGIPFVIASLTMNAVGNAAVKILEEVHRQFREIKGLLEGTAESDSGRCIDIATTAALKETILPGLILIAAPLVLGTLFGADALGGMLVGAILSGVFVALMMANGGGAWNNAKKYIEQGHLGGKGSEAHQAAAVGDTVGDPFKDTSGPSMNTVMKCMAVIALVCAPLFV